MRIGFDAKRAVSNNTGLGNYSRLVIDVLSHNYPDNEYLLYTPKIKDNVRLSPLLERSNVTLQGPRKGFDKMFSGLWRIGRGVMGDVSRDKCDWYHGLGNDLPLVSYVSTVVTIHDLIFFSYP